MPDRVLKPETRDLMLLALAGGLMCAITAIHDLYDKYGGEQPDEAHKALDAAADTLECVSDVAMRELGITNEEDPDASTPERD